MTQTPAFEILKHYIDHDDPAVRIHLTKALSAAHSEEAAELLLQLATEEDDPQVNDAAIAELAAQDTDLLRPLQATATQLHNKKMNRRNALKWFRSADLIAKATDTSLWHAVGSWWRETLNSGRLNRRLLLSSQSGYGILSRLLNRHIWVAFGLSQIIAMALFIFLVRSPDDDLFILMGSIGFITGIVGFFPLGLIMLPPSISFRKSSAAVIDARQILTYGLFLLVVVYWLLLQVILGERMPSEAYAQFSLFVIVPLMLVRLALAVRSEITDRLVYMALLCLIAVGTLVIYYGLAAWLITLGENTATFGDFLFHSDLSVFMMGPYLAICLPAAIFLALRIGIRGNLTPQIPTDPRRFTRHLIRWGALAAVGFSFIAVIGLKPGERLERLERQSEPIELPQSKSSVGNLKIDLHERVRLQLPTDGTLEIFVEGLFPNPNWDAVLYVDGQKIDKWRDQFEEFETEKQLEGELVVYADLTDAKVGINQLMFYFIDTLGDYFGGDDPIVSSDVQSRDATVVKFQLEYRWFPDPPAKSDLPQKQIDRTEALQPLNQIDIIETK